MKPTTNEIHETAVRRGISTLDAAADRKEPMRFLRHRDVMAWRRRQAIAELEDLARQTRGSLPTAQQFRGGPLVV